MTPRLDGLYIGDEVIVKFRPGAAPKVIEQAMQAHDAQTQAEPALAPLGVTVLKVPEGKVSEVVTGLRRNAAVEFAEPNYLVQAADTIPSDPGWSSQYGPVNIQAPQAWDITTGTISATIAVIDTGIDLNHPDLTSKIWNNPGETGADGNGDDKRTNGLDDDGDGYIDDWQGWDFVNGDNAPQDDQGHGTHVSGIAAAASNNGVGIAGMAWGARLMPLKVLDSTGDGTESDVASAMVWATDHGARVINLSLGGSGAASVLEDAVNYAYNHGVTVVAAAGNQGVLGVLYPAVYPNAIAVAWTDAGNNRSSFSNYGPEVDVAAPGTNIYSTRLGGGYGYKSGTSMSTPHVAGVAALLASLPQFDTPDKIRAALESTALDRGTPGWDQFYGYGLVQAYTALLFTGTVVLPTPTSTSTANAYGVVLSLDTDARSGVSGAVVTYTLQVTNTGNVADTYTVTVSGNNWETTFPATVGPVEGTLIIPVPPGGSFTITGTVTIPLTAAGGESDVATITVTSRGDSAKTATATLTTTVVVNKVYLPLITR